MDIPQKQQKNKQTLGLPCNYRKLSKIAKIIPTIWCRNVGIYLYLPNDVGRYLELYLPCVEDYYLPSDVHLYVFILKTKPFNF